MVMPTTAARTNGHAKEVDILRLGDTTEERRPVEINGRVLSAWVTTNGRYPASVAAELDDARNRWMSSRVPVDPRVSLPSTLWDAAETLADMFEQAGTDDEVLKEAAQQVTLIVRELQVDPEMRSTEVDWQTYLTSALCILIPGLERYEADMLDPVLRLRVVQELGYLNLPRTETAPEFPAEETTESDGGETPDPPEPTLSSIGAEPELDSGASTA